MFELWPALRSGFLDSFNPGGMAMMLWFFVFLTILGRRKKGIIGAGVFFIGGVFTVRFLFGTGLFDTLLLTKGFDIVLDVGYFVFAVLSFGGGIFFWRKWCILRRKETLAEAAPSTLPAPAECPSASLEGQKTPGVKKIMTACQSFFNQMGVGFGSGFALGLMQTAWAPDSYIQYTVMKLTLPADYLLYAQLLSIYSLAFVGLLVIMLWSVVAIKKSDSCRRWLEKSASVVSIMSSAILLAYGVSFLTYYF